MKTTETVTEVIDGDTFKTDSRSERIRIRDYDAPELDEPEGNVAKKSLEDLILYKQVIIEVVSKDSYGRPLANVWIEGQPVSVLMRYTMENF